MFSVYFNSTLIGHTALEKGDPPMGVALGKFIPEVGYQEVRPLLQPGETIGHLPSDSDRYLDGLSVKTPDGESLECVAGIVLWEYGDSEAPDAQEVTCLGIHHEVYERLFPHHVKTYNDQFRSK